ncbi:MAG: TIGR02757 family protein [Deltaproteobacteria bacterium]|nr:TIGR02757 family protein [Deltaproteobacteria bacterium]
METDRALRINRDRLERIRSIYHHRSFVDPDPLLFLYDYRDVGDREIAGLVASSLAYGRVVQIMRSVSNVLRPMGKNPSQFLADTSLKGLNEIYKDFRHRFTTGEEIALMLYGIKLVLQRYGSLQACFLEDIGREDDTILPALSRFVEKIKEGASISRSSLLPSPEMGSACKRLNLFMRWMVRKDQVDPGGWDVISASLLVIPLDTHMHRIGLRLDFTGRKQADMLAALEITNAFRKISPEDPVCYDFALTRLGIRGEMDEERILGDLGETCVRLPRDRKLVSSGK